MAMSELEEEALRGCEGPPRRHLESRPENLEGAHRLRRAVLAEDGERKLTVRRNAGGDLIITSIDRVGIPRFTGDQRQLELLAITPAWLLVRGNHRLHSRSGLRSIRPRLNLKQLLAI